MRGTITSNEFSFQTTSMFSSPFNNVFDIIDLQIPLCDTTMQNSRSPPGTEWCLYVLISRV